MPRVGYSGGFDLVLAHNVCAGVVCAVLGNTRRPPPDALGRGHLFTCVHEVGDGVMPLEEMRRGMCDREDDGD